MKIFVAYPYALTGYRQALSSTLQAPDTELIYADEHISSGHVLRKIEDMLATCDLALFDVTNGNPNVALELGIAIATPHPYVVAIRNSALSTLGADIHGWDQIRYDTVEELGTKLRALIDRGRVLARRKAEHKKAALWLYTSRPESLSGGPSGLTLSLTVGNDGTETAKDFTVRLHWSPGRARIGAGWISGGTFAVPFFEKHFDVPVYPGAECALPPAQVFTSQGAFSTEDIGWALLYADGQTPDPGHFMPLTSARRRENQKRPYRPA